jgi:hypothetical protein
LTGLLGQKHETVEIHSSEEAGRRFEIVRYTYPRTDCDRTIEVWLDPAANYLAGKTILTETRLVATPTVLRTESKVARFTEVAPAIFFPEQVERRHYNGNKLLTTTVISFSEVRVNEPMSNDTFDLQFPPGCLVQDAIRGNRYIAGAGGARLDESPLPASAPSPSPLSPGGGVTTKESDSWSTWLLPAGVILIAVTFASKLGRKWLITRRSPAA